MPGETYNIVVKVDPTGAERGTKRVNKALGRTEDRANKLRATLARAFAFLGGAMVLRQSIRLLADFGQSMSTVRAITQATGEQFARLTEEAQRLGTTTRFSASEAADGMIFLARAGFEVDEVMASIADTLDLAQAGALGLGQAADIASNVMQGFRLRADEASRVVDVLALAASSANTTVGQLGDGMKFVAPIASGMGVALEESAAAMAALSDAGLQAGMAGTGLRRVLSELESPSKMTQKLLDGINVSVQDVRPSTVGLTAALKTLATAGIDTGMALEIFGDRGGPAFEVLSSSIPKVVEMTAKLQNAEGTARRIAKIMDTNLRGALLAVRSAYEGLILRIGEAGVASSLEAIVRKLAGTLRYMAKNVDVVVRALGALTIVLGIRGVLGAVRMLFAAIIANPIGALITIITAAAVAVFAFANKIKIARDGVSTLGDVFRTTFGAIKQVVLPVLTEVGKALNDLLGEDFEISIRGFAEAMAFGMDRATGAVRGAVFLVRDLLVMQLGDVLKGSLLILKRFGLMVRRFFEELGNRIVGLFTSPMVTMAKALQVLINSVAGVAAVAAQLGVISEESRISVENMVAGVDASISALEKRKIKSFFDVTDTKKKIADLDSQISTVFGRIGQGMSRSFQEGFDRDTFLGFVRSIFDEAEQTAKERTARLAAEAARAAKAAKQEAADVTEEKGTQAEIKDRLTRMKQMIEANKLTAEQTTLLQELDGAQLALSKTTRILGELYDHGDITIEKYNQKLRELKIAALEADTSLQGGLARGLLRIQDEIEDVGTLAENVLVNAFHSAEDAMVEFVRTGQVNFQQMVDSMLDDIARLLVRLLILQAVQAVTGVGPTPGAGGLAALGSRQHGGPVEANRPYLVGEEGPEIFEPAGAGRIIPADQTAAVMSGGGTTVVAPAPEVNVQVINVTDPAEVPGAMDSPAGDKVILNAIARNKHNAKRLLS